MRRTRTLALVAVALLGAACTSARATVKSTKPSTKAGRPPAHPGNLGAGITPAGWVPVDYGNARVSVPNHWAVTYDATCVDPLDEGNILVLGVRAGRCPLTLIPGVTPRSSTMILTSLSNLPSGGAYSSATVNGIAVKWRRADGFAVYVVPSLQLVMTVSGPLSNELSRTLSHAPAVFVAAAGAAPQVPVSWRWIRAGGIRVAVPGSWPTQISQLEGLCIQRSQPSDPESVSNAAVVDTDQSLLQSSCLASELGGIAPDGLAFGADGLIVNLHPHAGPSATEAGRCLQLHGLRACVYDDQWAGLDVLLVQVKVPGRAGYEQLEIGLTGSGLLARTILYSIGPA